MCTCDVVEFYIKPLAFTDAHTRACTCRIDEWSHYRSRNWSRRDVKLNARSRDDNDDDARPHHGLYDLNARPPNVLRRAHVGSSVRGMIGRPLCKLWGESPGLKRARAHTATLSLRFVWSASRPPGAGFDRFVCAISRKQRMEGGGFIVVLEGGLSRERRRNI